MIEKCGGKPRDLRKMYERYALRSVCGVRKEEESWWDKRHKRMKKLLKEQVEHSTARRKAERECYLSSFQASSLRLSQFLQQETYSPQALEPDKNVAVAVYENLMELFTRDFENKN